MRPRYWIVFLDISLLFLALNGIVHGEKSTHSVSHRGHHEETLNNANEVALDSTPTSVQQAIESTTSPATSSSGTESTVFESPDTTNVSMNIQISTPTTISPILHESTNTLSLLLGSTSLPITEFGSTRSKKPDTTKETTSPLPGSTLGTTSAEETAKDIKWLILACVCGGLTLTCLVVLVLLLGKFICVATDSPNENAEEEE